MADTQRLGRHRQVAPPGTRRPGRRGRRLAAALAAACITVAITVIFAMPSPSHPRHPGAQHIQGGLSVTPSSYIGLYSSDGPDFNAGVQAFTTATGVKPNLVLYYSGWPEPFQVSFARTVSSENAVPLVQMDPDRISVAAVATGRYDNYLTAFAKAVRAYSHPIILSFGHEMNGYWYNWGYTHTSPATFVAAWRHIVTLFRNLGTRNVTWMWTINTIHKHTGVPSPGPWWPGRSYVNWVGIDGYYTDSSSVFASVFGPTIVYIRTLTSDPILISETSVRPAASQPAKIADLFAGIHLYRLLGFVWYDSVYKVDWRLSGPAAFSALRQNARKYQRPAS